LSDASVIPNPAPLVLLGRSFDGFNRAFARQFEANADLPARHELLEIGALENAVLDGDAATSGDVDVLLVITDWLPALIESGRLLALAESLMAVRKLFCCSSV